LFVCKVRTRNCATSRGPAQPRSGSGDWRHAADSSRTRGGSSAHRVGEGCRPEHQAGRAAGVRRSRMSSRRAWRRDETVCARTMGKNISRPKQVTDWVARLEKLEQALAAESDSGLLVQPAWIDKQECARRLRHQFTGPDNPGLTLSGSPATRGRPRLGWRERSSRG